MSSRLAAPVGLVLALAAAAAAACDLDQEQARYDGGTSARTLPGYTTWQSFTPSQSGVLCRLDMGFFNDMSGQGRLDVLAGDGTSGTVLATYTVPVVGITQPGVTWNEWAVDVAVVAGQVYTFNLTPDAATLPDPYGVAIGAGDPYPGGTMGIDDPSGSYRTSFDVVFRTHVGVDAGIAVYRDVVPYDVDAPANRVATGATSPFADLTPPTATLLYYLADDGFGDPALIGVKRLAGGGVRIEW